MKIGNQVISNRPQVELKALADEFTWIGRENQLTENMLVVFAIPPEKVKECENCGLVKPFKEFKKRKQSPDGRADYCKKCASRDEPIHRDKRVEDHHGAR